MSPRAALHWAAAVIAAALVGGCRAPAEPPRDSSVAAVTAAGVGAPLAVPAVMGQPLATLDAEARRAFDEGRVQFARTFTVADGLGPHFNAPSCLACHGNPTSGGHGDIQHAARIVGIGEDVTGLPAQAIAGFAPLQPEPGQPVSLHKPPPLYGLGLLEAIPDRDIAERCGNDPKLGIAGVANVNPGVGRVGRFGFKAHAATLQDFIGNAMSLEMGLTNPAERDPRLLRDEDAIVDPEAATPTVAALVAYVQGLQPPPRARQDEAGQGLFTQLGCATCHRPQTARGVEAFSDLCLHDLGAAFDNGLKDLKAGPSQWRTAPLWGLRFRTRYFHDDRAPSLDSAIRMHGGEATRVRERYVRLPPAEQARLLGFLRSL